VKKLLGILVEDENVMNIEYLFCEKDFKGAFSTKKRELRL